MTSPSHCISVEPFKTNAYLQTPKGGLSVSHLDSLHEISRLKHDVTSVAATLKNARRHHQHEALLRHQDLDSVNQRVESLKENYQHLRSKERDAALKHYLTNPSTRKRSLDYIERELQAEDDG